MQDNTQHLTQIELAKNLLRTVRHAAYATVNGETRVEVAAKELVKGLQS